EDLAQRYAAAIERFRDRNPYYHYGLGNVAYGQGDLELAQDHYRQAIRRKDSEPEFYLALSIILGELGDPEEAERMLGRARYLVANSDIYFPSEDRVRIFDRSNTASRVRPGLRSTVD